MYCYLEQQMIPTNKNPLTNRENEILQLILDDFSNKEISVKIGLSVNTIITHRKNIMKKTE